MLQSSTVLDDVFYIFFSFRNVLQHVMCQIKYDECIVDYQSVRLGSN